MARLINDSGVLGKTTKVTAKTVNSVSFDKIIEAIGVMQDRMGITGTTAKEAGATIAGSVGAMKSAWTNLITGLADGNADIGKLIDNLVTTIVGDGTKENLGVIGNILPAIERALGGAVKLIEGAAPKIIEILPGLVEKVLPSLISAATDMVGAFTDVLPSLLSTVIDAIISNGPMLIDAAVGLIDALITAIDDNYEMLILGAGKIVGHLVNGIFSMLPRILEVGLNIVGSLADGIASYLPGLIPSIVDLILKIVEVLTRSDSLDRIIDAAFVIIDELAWGIGDALPELVEAILLIVDKIVSVLLKPENLAKIIQSSFQITLAITQGLINAIPNLLKGVETIILDIVAQFKDADWEGIGKNLVDGFKKGIKNAWSNMKKWFKNLFGDLIGIAKNILGIASPSKVFKKLGFWTADGFGIGFEDEFAHVKDDMEDALNFDDASIGINASVRKIGAGTAGGAFGGTSIGNITINIDGAKYSNEQSLAEAVAEAIQSMTDRRAAVYA